MTAPVLTRPSAARAIPVRRVSLSYPTDSMPHHFADGDLVMSHVIASLSAMFPSGEDFFVRSVRNYRDRITDPELARQVRGFIGQEAIHGREHRTFNEHLAEMGYPTRSVDRWVRRRLGVADKVLPKSVRLAITAALEHYTATLAAALLANPEAQEIVRVEEVQRLFLWHALEESEHKAVAFDVYQEVRGSHAERVGVMAVVSVLFLAALTVWSTISLVKDPASRDLRRLRRSLASFRRSPLTSAEVGRQLFDYRRRKFHPDDHDTTDLLETWRRELFADEQVGEAATVRG